MKQFFFLTALFISTQIQATHPLKQLFANNHWGFIEDEFIIKPEQKFNQITQKIKRWLPTIASCIASGYGTDLLAQRYIPEETFGNFKIQAFTRVFGTPSSGILSAIGMYKLVSHITKTALMLEALERFIVEWRENKQFTPQQLHESFEELHTLYMRYGQAHLIELTPEMIRLIKNAIYHHFPHKYAQRIHTEEKSVSINFWHTIVTCDVVELIKVIGNIFSSFWVEQEK